MQSFRRACGLLAILGPSALAVACSDPELASELVSEGAPEVVEVNALTESGIASPLSYLTLGEGATYCRPGGDYKVNTFYCPEERDATDAPIAGQRAIDPAADVVPFGDAQGYDNIWHVRLIFDELLDPSVEDLETADDGGVVGTIRNTRPVRLVCGGEDVDYDGFYDPSGNHLSYPPGPGLVVTVSEFVAATGTACSVEIVGDIKDKDGQSVPSGQLGPYEFSIAPLSLTGIAPANEQEGVDPTSPLALELNAPIDLSTVEAAVTLAAGDTGVPLVFAYAVDSNDEDIEYVVLAAPEAGQLDPQTAYALTVDSGIADTLGGPLALDEPVEIGFTTGEVPEE